MWKGFPSHIATSEGLGARKMLSRDTKTIVDWLADGARSTVRTQDALGELCERLLRCEIPIWRVGLFVLTLDPLVMGQRFLWKPGAEVDVTSAPFEAFLSDEFRNSPVRRVIETGVVLRRRLADNGCPMDFATVRELREQGATDYLAVPLFFADGVVHGATFATQQPGGFTDAQIADLESVFAPLSRVVENRTLRRTATTLLDTYVGNQGGSRILAGQIRRGDAETIDAAIWLSDMRGFTALTDRLKPQNFCSICSTDISIVRYLRSIVRAGRFSSSWATACSPFFRSHPMERTRGRSVALRLRPLARPALPSHLRSTRPRNMSSYVMRFGLALHLGQVLYGNVGSGIGWISRASARR